MIRDLPPISPSSFFHVSASIPRWDKKKKKHTYLPDTSGLLSEDLFARAALYWDEAGLSFHVDVQKPVEEVFFPGCAKGDGVELFIDTHNLKATHSITPFSHHFVFLPMEVDGIQGEEVTAFRGDDKHELADPHHFVIKTTLKKREYTMDIEIPKEALYGYDPDDFASLGFTYRINRYKGKPQHFAVSSTFFSIEKHPELWATLYLTKQ